MQAHGLDFVGFGHIGGHMASRFLLQVTVFGEARSRRDVQHLIDQGLQWCDTPTAVAEAADVVFTSVPDDRVLEEVASGPDGILAGLVAGKTWVEVSTTSPTREPGVRRALRAQGDVDLHLRSPGASAGGGHGR